MDSRRVINICKLDRYSFITDVDRFYVDALVITLWTNTELVYHVCGRSGSTRDGDLNNHWLRSSLSTLIDNQVIVARFKWLNAQRVVGKLETSTVI